MIMIRNHDYSAPVYRTRAYGSSATPPPVPPAVQSFSIALNRWASVSWSPDRPLRHSERIRRATSCGGRGSLIAEGTPYGDRRNTLTFVWRPVFGIKCAILGKVALHDSRNRRRERLLVCRGLSHECKRGWIHVWVREITCLREEILHVAFMRQMRCHLAEDDVVEREALAVASNQLI